MMFDSATNDTLHCIEAMKAQEETTQCHNYFEPKASIDIDESSRKSMAIWCQQVQKSLQLSSETVWIAMSFFDRYLISGKGKSREALEDRYKFQLAAITSFYIAVKIYETVELDAVTLAKLCRDYYAAADIASMEKDILFALDWRMSCPTPMDFARQMIEFLPQDLDSSISECILESTQKYVDGTVTDFFFTFCKPSVTGASCLSSSLTGSNVLSSLERQAFWLEVAKVTDLADVLETQNKLLEGIDLSKPITLSSIAAKKSDIASKAVGSNQNKTLFAYESSSPVCVTQTARQA